MSSLAVLHDELLRGINDNAGLVRECNKVISSSALPPDLVKKHREIMVEMAFVRIYTAWEYFLEKCFLAYMMGEETTSGFCPVRYVLPVDEEHAKQLALGGRDYVQWTDPSTVRAKAKLCFKDGEPFDDILSSATKALQDINTVRNAIVHRSLTALEKFMHLVREELTSVPSDISPGKYLLTLKTGTIRATYFSSYQGKLIIYAKKIVPS